MRTRRLFDLTKATLLTAEDNKLIISTGEKDYHFSHNDIDGLHFYWEENTFSNRAIEKIKEWMGYKE